MSKVCLFLVALQIRVDPREILVNGYQICVSCSKRDFVKTTGEMWVLTTKKKKDTQRSKPPSSIISLNNMSSVSCVGPAKKKKKKSLKRPCLKMDKAVCQFALKAAISDHLLGRRFMTNPKQKRECKSMLNRSLASCSITNVAVAHAALKAF